MAQLLRFIDSFDHYPTAELLKKWTTFGGFTAGSTVSVGAWGRNGTNGLKFTSTRSALSITIPGGASQDIAIGSAVWFQVDAGADAFGNGGIYSWWNGTTEHLILTLDPSTHLLKLYRGQDKAVLLATGARVLQLGVWYSIEVAVHIADAGGTVVVRINELEDINFTGDTNQAGSVVDHFELGYDSGDGAGVGMEYRYDDVYVSSGGLSFYGDCRAEALFPNGVGGLSQFVPNGAGANYTKVNEVLPDDDTTYVASSGVGQRDSYQYTNLSPTSAGIKGVQFVPRARTDDEGARVIKSFYRSPGGVNYDSPNSLSLTSSYSIPIGDIMEKDPSDNSAWTLAKIANAEFGVKVEA